MTGIFWAAEAVAFILFFPVPLFARRFGKFLPADAGTALVRSFHIPRFAASNSPVLRARRKRLWMRLLGAGALWGVAGAAFLYFLFAAGYPLALLVFLWLGALMACVDERLHLLPDVLTVPLLIAGFFAAANFCGIVTAGESAAGAVFGFALPTVTAAIMTPFLPRSLGGGDFKMMTALGAWLGVAGLAVAVLASVVFFILIAAARKNREGPYGASLFLGMLTVLVLRCFEPAAFLFVVV